MGRKSEEVTSRRRRRHTTGLGREAEMDTENLLSFTTSLLPQIEPAYGATEQIPNMYIGCVEQGAG